MMTDLNVKVVKDQKGKPKHRNTGDDKAVALKGLPKATQEDVCVCVAI